MVQGTSALEPREAMWLLNSVAEQLKMPLTTIARHAELGQFASSGSISDLTTIRTHAVAALTLVDSYLLGLQLLRDQTGLVLEPVSVSSTLVETAHELDGLAKQYDTKLELRIAGKYAPVMAHRFGLKAALLALGYALLEGGSPAREQAHRSASKLVLAAYRTPHGIVAGLYGDYEQLNTETWRKALALKARASQPLNGLGGNGAGLFVAEAILQAMSARLRTSKYLKQQGLATTLQPSQQLHFV